LDKIRIFFVSDIHGSERMFMKLVNAATSYKAQILIVGGDIAGKSITPVFTQDSDVLSYEANFQDTRRLASNERELEALRKDIRSIGNYPYLTTRDEWTELVRDEEKMDRVFDFEIKESVERWNRIASERLKPLGARLIANKGNDDPPILEETLTSSDFIEYPNEKVVQVADGLEMPSLGYSNITPWHLPGDLPENSLKEKLDLVFSQVRDAKRSILNVHVPPYNTHLDLAPKLDENLSPILSPGGEPEFTHVGSTAVREAIEQYGPVASLHGHIHESRGYSKIGLTHCFNPGSEYGAGILKGVILDFSDGKLVNHLFTEG
jgi:uncharacterized protein